MLSPIRYLVGGLRTTVAGPADRHLRRRRRLATESSTFRRGEMFRHQFHAQVKLGRFRDFYATFEEFEKVVRARKLAPPQLWAGSFGDINRIVIVREHDRIQAYDADNRACLADSDCMDLWRELSQLVDGRPWDELLQTAPQIA